MEVYLKNLHGQEYKLVEVDTPAKPANDASGPATPPSKLD
jgi:potassium-dependent mechanosensitive channel